MNKQPFYHRAVILFTATGEVDRDALQIILRNGLDLKELSILLKTIEVEELDNEVGDPHDL